jgi:CubicO group peptidase (beta-lactamase class C family)
MEGISRRGFLGWTAWTAAGLGASRLLGVPALSAAETSGSPALLAIDQFVERHRKERGLPGLTLGIAGRNGLVAAKTYGHAGVKTGLPVTPQNLFEIGSITKSFVGLTLLQLRDEGRSISTVPSASISPGCASRARTLPLRSITC